MFLIKPFDLEAWKMNSIELARRTGKYDNALLNEMQERVEVRVKDGLPIKGTWYGKCSAPANRKYPLIEVYSRNMSTEEGDMLVIDNMVNARMENGLVIKVCNVIESFPREKFFQMFNQSGMDHELIGHVYHYLKKLEFGEEIAVYTQLDLAKERAKKDSDWGRVIKLMFTALNHHKRFR